MRGFIRRLIWLERKISPMQRKRYFAKLPPPPLLEKELIERLTELCFIKDNPQKSDILFVFGISFGFHELAQHLKILIPQKLAPITIITGGIPNFEDSSSLQEPEAEIIYKTISCYLSPDISVIRETQSTNTLENVLFAKNKLENANLSVARLLFICRSHHSRRCLLTLQKYFPQAQLYPSSYHMMGTKESKLIMPDNWHTFPEGISRVWGEYLRIRHYGQLGDIAFSPVAKLVKNIEALIK